MSVYSGFTSKAHQAYYDKLLYNIISTLLIRITKFYQHEQIDQHSFIKIIQKQCKTLTKLQKKKVQMSIIQCLQPKYSDLIHYFLITIQSLIKQINHNQLAQTINGYNQQNQSIKDFNQISIQKQKKQFMTLIKIQQQSKKQQFSKKKNNSSSSHRKSLDCSNKIKKKPTQSSSITSLHQLLILKNLQSKHHFNRSTNRSPDNFSQQQQKYPSGIIRQRKNKSVKFNISMPQK